MGGSHLWWESRPTSAWGWWAASGGSGLNQGAGVQDHQSSISLAHRQVRGLLDKNKFVLGCFSNWVSVLAIHRIFDVAYTQIRVYQARPKSIRASHQQTMFETYSEL